MINTTQLMKIISAGIDVKKTGEDSWHLSFPGLSPAKRPERITAAQRLEKSFNSQDLNFINLINAQNKDKFTMQELKTMSGDMSSKRVSAILLHLGFEKSRNRALNNKTVYTKYNSVPTVLDTKKNGLGREKLNQ